MYAKAKRLWSMGWPLFSGGVWNIFLSGDWPGAVPGSPSSFYWTCSYHLPPRIWDLAYKFFLKLRHF